MYRCLVTAASVSLSILSIHKLFAVHTYVPQCHCLPTCMVWGTAAAENTETSSCRQKSWYSGLNASSAIEGCRVWSDKVCCAKINRKDSLFTLLILFNPQSYSFTSFTSISEVTLLMMPVCNVKSFIINSLCWTVRLNNLTFEYFILFMKPFSVSGVMCCYKKCINVKIYYICLMIIISVF